MRFILSCQTELRVEPDSHDETSAKRDYKLSKTSLAHLSFKLRVGPSRKICRSRSDAARLECTTFRLFDALVSPRNDARISPGGRRGVPPSIGRPVLKTSIGSMLEFNISARTYLRP